MRAMTCDICGSPMEWTEQQVRMDAALHLMGSGLGAMCDPCGDRELEIIMRDEARIAAQEAGEDE